MTCIVNGDRRRSEVDGKGLVVPCLYIFKGKQKHLERLISLFASLILLAGHYGIIQVQNPERNMRLISNTFLIGPSLFSGLDYWTGLLDSRKLPLGGERNTNA